MEPVAVAGADHTTAAKESTDAGSRPLVVGIDVDGVLANHISGVLSEVRKRHGLRLGYNDISSWLHPIGPTNIAEEICNAQRNRSYVLGMRLYPGAKGLFQFLRQQRARVLIVTARPVDTRKWTETWLRRNNLIFDRLEMGTEARKSVHGIDVLIDDYLGNALEFLKNSDGVAILVDQPWNRDRAALADYRKEGRLLVVQSLAEVRRIWPRVAAHLAESLTALTA